MIKRNVGAPDRLVRGALGLAVLSLIFLGPQTAWGYIGMIALLSAASGFCPLYGVFGLNSCKVRK